MLLPKFMHYFSYIIKCRACYRRGMREEKLTLSKITTSAKFATFYKLLIRKTRETPFLESVKALEVEKCF